MDKANVILILCGAVFALWLVAHAVSTWLARRSVCFSRGFRRYVVVASCLLALVLVGGVTLGATVAANSEDYIPLVGACAGLLLVHAMLAGALVQANKLRAAPSPVGGRAGASTE